MAKVTFDPLIESVNGRLGNVVYCRLRGNFYIRAHCIPRNPRTASQQKNRSAFAEAVKLWRELPPEEKSEYNRIAKGKPLSGYNMFISVRMKGIPGAAAEDTAPRQGAYRERTAPFQIKSSSVPESSLPLSVQLPHAYDRRMHLLSSHFHDQCTVYRL